MRRNYTLVVFYTLECLSNDLVLPAGPLSILPLYTSNLYSSTSDGQDPRIPLVVLSLVSSSLPPLAITHHEKRQQV